MASMFSKACVTRRAFNHLSAACLATVLGWPAQAALAAGAGWPQTGHDAAGSSFNAGESTLSSSNLTNIRPAWTLVRDTSRVVSANGQAFVNVTEPDDSGAYRGYLVRLDPRTGATVWQVPAPESSGSPAILSDRVIASGHVSGTSDGQVTAFDKATGAILWTMTLPADPPHTTGLGAPLVSGGRAYLLSAEGEVLVLDTATGAQVWRHRIDPSKINYPQGMVVASGKVFVSDYTIGLIALDAADGHELWRYALPTFYNLESRPLAVADKVLVNDGEGRVHSLNALTGQVNWITTTRPSRNASGIEPLASDGKRVYALNGISRRQLTAIDLTTGGVLWDVGAGVNGKDVTVANGVVYFIGSQLKAVTAVSGAAIPTTTIKSLNSGFSELSLADGQLFIRSTAPNGDVRLQAYGLPAAP